MEEEINTLQNCMQLFPEDQSQRDAGLWAGPLVFAEGDLVLRNGAISVFQLFQQLPKPKS